MVLSKTDTKSKERTCKSRACGSEAARVNGDSKATLGNKCNGVHLQRIGAMCCEQDMADDRKINTVRGMHTGDAERSTPHWYREQAANYGKTHEHSDERAAHNNLPLRSGDNGTDHPGKRTERGHTAHTVILVFDCL